jgi:hypothetical protein
MGENLGSYIQLYCDLYRRWLLCLCFFHIGAIYYVVISVMLFLLFHCHVVSEGLNHKGISMLCCTGPPVQHIVLYRSSCSTYCVVHIFLFNILCCTGPLVQHIVLYKSSCSLSCVVQVLVFNILCCTCLPVQYIVLYRSSCSTYCVVQVFLFPFRLSSFLGNPGFRNIKTVDKIFY